MNIEDCDGDKEKRIMLLWFCMQSKGHFDKEFNH